jgi:3-hydroxymyristoyl/3-hydroxydecanoyl-(acyl carrier protein) dehydratase
MNILLLAAFGSTCFFPPNMIFRFALMQDKSIRGSLGEKKIYAYCHKVTLVWCTFFVFNGSMAAWTIFSGSDALWSVYNGGVSYILMGTLFIGEFIIRKMVHKKKEDVRQLFSGGSAGFNSLDKEKIIEKTGHSVILEFSVPQTSPYFDGHFPGIPILPAVAQIELVLRFASRYLGTGIGLSDIRRVKFSNLVRPFAPLLLSLQKKEKHISFKISSPDGEIAYSAGTIILEAE